MKRWIYAIALGGMIAGVAPVQANHWLYNAPGTNWFDGANWELGVPPTLTSAGSRIPAFGAIEGHTYEVHIGEPGGAEAFAIDHSLYSQVESVNLRIHSDLTLSGGMTVRYPG